MNSIKIISFNENNNNNTSFCSVCNNNFKTVSDPESGEIICNICGIVLSDEKKLPLHPRVHEEMAVISHANTTITTTTNPNTNLQHLENNILLNIESPTIIGKSNVDAVGKKISNDMQNKIDKLRIWEQRTRYINPKDRNLKYVFNKLNNIKHKLGLSNAIVEKSFYIYRKASSLGLVQGRTTEGILSSAIYLACKELETPKTLKEISDITNVKIKSISKYSRLLIFELDLKPIPVIDPIKCIVKIANNLNLDEKIKHKAIKIMKEVMKEDIHVGKNPLSIAASTIYAVCKTREENDKTQLEIANSADISAVVVRDRYNDIIKKINLEQMI
ncbi:MAG: transcription initiation factor IIB [Deltaproteobacteria bacterium]